MKIKVWKSERTPKEVEVQFPIYTRWITSDSADTFNRVDAKGLCISIGKDDGDYRDRHDGPAWEIKRLKFDLSATLDGSYVSDGDRTKECTEAQFLAVFDEAIAAIQATRADIV